MRNILIIQPFNSVFYIFIGTVFILTMILTYFLSKKDGETRRKIMIVVTVIIAIFLLFYKSSYRLDQEFINDYSKYWGEYTILNELPINPCNIVLLLLPIGLWKKSDYCLSYCVYMGLIATLIAVCVPQQGYAGYYVFKWHTFGFFLLHSLGVFIPASIVILKLYIPKYKDIFKATAVLLISTIISYFVSIFLRKAGLCEFANYSFTMEPEGNPVLGFFYKLIPVKGLYLLGALIIFWPVSALIVTLCRAINKGR